MTAAWMDPGMFYILGSPVVLFSLFLVQGFPYTLANPKEGCPYWNMVTGLPSIPFIEFKKGRFEKYSAALILGA